MPASAMLAEMLTAIKAWGCWFKQLWIGSSLMPSMRSLFCWARTVELMELWTLCLPQSLGLWRWQILENLRLVLLWILQSQTLPGTTCLAINIRLMSALIDGGQ